MTHSGRIYTLDKLMVKQKRDGEKGKERINEFQEPLDLRSNPFQGGGNDAILPPKGIG